MAQCVRSDGRVVTFDRRAGRFFDAAAVEEKFGVPPASIPDYLALVGDSADGYPGLPGWGARSTAAVLQRYPHLEDIPDRVSAWDVAVRGAASLARTLAEHRDEALLYRELATLRTDAPIPQSDAEQLRWNGRGPARPSPALAVRLRCAGPPAGSALPDRTAGRSETPSRPRPRSGSPYASISRYVAWCGAGAATMPMDLLGMPTSNQRLPSREVTMAPPSMAMTPAAQMSQVERPLPLHVGVEAAVGDVGEAQGGAAHRARDAHGSSVARVLAREARAWQAQVHDGVPDALLAGIVDGHAIKEGALPGDGVEELITDGIEDHAEQRLAIDDEADADREEGDAVGVVDGAVERVDDPESLRLGARGTRFLGQYRIAGEGRADDLEDGRLAQVVDLGDDVLLALVDDALEPLVVIDVDGPRRARRLDGHLELAVKVGVGHRPDASRTCGDGSARRAGQSQTMLSRSAA